MIYRTALQPRKTTAFDCCCCCCPASGFNIIWYLLLFFRRKHADGSKSQRTVCIQLMQIYDLKRFFILYKKKSLQKIPRDKQYNISSMQIFFCIYKKTYSYPLVMFKKNIKIFCKIIYITIVLIVRFDVQIIRGKNVEHCAANRNIRY